MNFDEFNKELLEFEKNIQEKARKHLKYERESYSTQDELTREIELSLHYIYCINTLISISDKYKYRELCLEKPKLPENDEDWDSVFYGFLSMFESHIGNINTLIYMIEEDQEEE